MVHVASLTACHTHAHAEPMQQQQHGDMNVHRAVLALMRVAAMKSSNSESTLEATRARPPMKAMETERAQTSIEDVSTGLRCLREALQRAT